MDIKRLVYLVAFLSSLGALWHAWRTEHPVISPTVITAAQQANEEIPEAQRTRDVSADGMMAEPPASVASEPLPDIKLATDVMEVTINPVGATLSQVVLTQFKDTEDTQKPFILLDNSQYDFFVAQTGLTGANVPNHQSIFKLVEKTGEPGQSQTLTFVAEQSGVRLLKTYTFKPGSYLIDVSQRVENRSNAPIRPEGYYQLMRRDLTKDEKDARGLERTYFGPAFYTDDTKFEKISFEDILSNSQRANPKALVPTNVDNGWVAMVEHYFVGAWLPQKGHQYHFDFYAKPLGNNRYRVGMIVPFPKLEPGQAATEHLSLYVGPQEQKKLEAVAVGFDRVVDYGWLTLIAAPIFWLLEFLQGFVVNWGVAIILLTLIIKLIFFPLTAASQKSMAKMKDVAPRIKQLQELYKDDRERLNKEMMTLYQTEKINPLGGCLPILVQIPVFIALYSVLLSSVELRHAPFALWITDLSSRDPYFVLPIILGVTSFLQMKMSPPPPDPMQAKVMMFLPLVFTVMFLWFPSGLVLYWLVSNLVSIAQQWYIMRRLNKPKAKKAASSR